MSEERDTWPPRIGQSVWIKPEPGLGTVLELLPGDRVAVRRTLSTGTVTPGTEEFVVGGLEEWALDELRPKDPHLVPEWRRTPE